MKTSEKVFVVTILACAIATSPAQAQVVVVANPNSGGCRIGVNTRDANAEAWSKAGSARDGWYTVLASGRRGYGAVFGAKNPRDGKTNFFAAYGYSTSEEAISAAREKAVRWVRQLGVFSTAFICENWNNRGEYALDTGTQDAH